MAQLLVDVEEALLGAVLDLQHQYHPEPGVGVGLLLPLRFGQSCHDPLSALGRTLRAAVGRVRGVLPAWEGGATAIGPVGRRQA